MPLPVVLRGPSGGGVRASNFHSINPETWFAYTGGIKIMCPATPSDAKGLLKSAIRDDNPSLFLEHKALYRRIKEHVSEDPELLVPIGSADVKRAGDDVTIVTYGAMVHKALEAAESLEGRGVSVEVVDLRTVYPIDEDTVLALDREDLAGAGALRVVPIPRDRRGGRVGDRGARVRAPGRAGDAPGAAEPSRAVLPAAWRTRSCRRWPISRPPSTDCPPGEETAVTSIQMPQLGETIVEGTILKWLKQEGDAVAADEPLFEISTDKVDTEVPSPVAGTVTKLLVAEGATVPVGTAVMEIDDGTGAGAGAGVGSDGGGAAGGSTGPATSAAPAAAPVGPPPTAPVSAAPAAAPARSHRRTRCGRRSGSGGGSGASVADLVADRAAVGEGARDRSGDRGRVR